MSRVIGDPRQGCGLIYDRLNSPILWIENDSDKSELGQSRAIPSEYIHGVIEVKSTCTRESCNDALEKLKQLNPIHEFGAEDGEGKGFNEHFFSSVIFEDFKSVDQYNTKMHE